MVIYRRFDTDASMRSLISRKRTMLPASPYTEHLDFAWRFAKRFAIIRMDAGCGDLADQEALRNASHSTRNRQADHRHCGGTFAQAAGARAEAELSRGSGADHGGAARGNSRRALGVRSDGIRRDDFKARGRH